MEKKGGKLRTAVAVALVAAMLVAVPFVLTDQNPSAEPDKSVPTIYFEGMDLVIDENGNIQALMDVYVRYVLDSYSYSFDLKYDSTLIVPSDHSTNEPLGTTNSGSVFKYNPELLKVQEVEDGDWSSVDPFEKTDTWAVHQPESSELTITLILDRKKLKPMLETAHSFSGNVENIGVVTEQSGEFESALSLVERNNDGTAEETAANTSIKLGTLSFRVQSQDALAELVKTYGSTKSYWYKNENTTEYLNNGISEKKVLSNFSSKTTVWSISCYTDTGSDIKTQDGASTSIYRGSPIFIPESAAAVFEYDFGSGLISAEPLKNEITINAYQAYTDPGYTGATAYKNLAIALGKYAPTVVASYADSTVKNYTIGWGLENVDDPDNTKDRTYDFTLYSIEVDENGVEVEGSRKKIEAGDPYDPTHGHYVATQYFYYPTDDGYQAYPTPMEVRINVTPVTAVSVSADDLTDSYNLKNAPKEYSKLGLPREIRINTDVQSGAASLYLEVGSDVPSWQADDLDTLMNTAGEPWRKGSTTTPGEYEYNTGEFVLTIDELATDTSAPDTAENRHTSAVYATEMRAKYPWLTVNEHKFDIEAVRTVVSDETALPPDDMLVVHNYTTANDYSQISSGDYTDDNLSLTLAIAYSSTGKSFTKNEIFRVRMPNGEEIDWAIFEGEGDSASNPKNVLVYDPDTDADIPVSKSDDSAYTIAYDVGGIVFDEGTRNGATTITLKPGMTSEESAVGDHKVARAELRRWINLGGWFEIAMCENPNEADPASNVWTEFFPVYVSPRTNYYEEDKTYNFIGLNAGLFDYYDDLGDTVVLPQGSYRPIDIATNTLATYEADVADEEGRVETVTLPLIEDYGILTTYDAVTGEQPGITYSFSVEALNNETIWGTVVTPTTAADGTTTYPDSGIPDADTHANYDKATITRYNTAADDGQNDYAEAAFSRVGMLYNAAQSGNKQTTTGRDNVLYEPTLRFEETGASKPLESLKLVYKGEAAQNNIAVDDAGEVTRVTFDAQTVGYTVRQSFELTLINDGDTDIDGIYIDTLTDLYAEGYNEFYPDSEAAYGGHFEITDPPASFLAAGTETTFTVTYVYNLGVLSRDGEELDYLDKLYIRTNAYGSDSVKEFDATFHVSANEISRVTVIVLPEFPDPDDPTKTFTLGEAGVIVGSDGSGGYDYSYTSTMRTEGSTVYIGTFPYEEYKVKEIYAVPALAEENEITNISSGVKTDKSDDTGVYSFKMPSGAVTVYVVMSEPTSSKLRPGELNIYASDVYDTNICTEDNLQTMWKKEFTTDELAVTDPLKLMLGGAASESGFHASTAHYLVVLEEEHKYVQAEMLLRKVVALAPAGDLAGDAIRDQLDEKGYTDFASYINDNISGIDIEMWLYDLNSDGEAVKATSPVYSSKSAPLVGADKTLDGATAATPDANKGDTSVPTKHRSTTFDAPAVGGRRWLVITLSVTADEGLVERSYYIEIVRRPSHSVTLAYGNSPVGMIYNTSSYVSTTTDPLTGVETVDTTVRDAALEAFKADRSFENVEAVAGSLPYAFTSTDVVFNYSTDYLYNKEAWIEYGLLYDPDSLTDQIYDATTGTYTGSYAEMSGDEYLDLDLDPYAIFALIGEDFLDPGLIEIKDSSMRSVDPSRVNVYIENAVLLDDDAATQEGRFAGTTTTNIRLGTLENAMELADKGVYTADFWQSTHNFQNLIYNRNGVEYIVWSVGGIDHTGDPDGNQKMFFEFTEGNFYPLNSPFDKLDDPADIAGLEPVIIDKDPEGVSIRPGVYDLIYEFADFDAKDSDTPIRITRKIVILGKVGDANADGSAHNDASAKTASAVSDETIIENRVEDALGCEHDYDGANAFKFRTIDANNDRNVNNIDANELHSALDELKQFYKPTDYVEGGYPTTEVSE